ncbi:MAG: hypothetical protein EYC70_16065 [Planctomycetota bacterium]|nr:MAG: hypothetical protein EYC70_16065 [Planctomycetota bacterium]
MKPRDDGSPAVILAVLVAVLLLLLLAGGAFFLLAARTQQEAERDAAQALRAAEAARSAQHAGTPAPEAAPEAAPQPQPAAPVPAAGTEPGAAEGADEEPGAGLIPPRRLDVEQPAQRVVPWEQAAAHVGEVIAVEGRIVRTHNSGRACFLNFAEDWRGKFHGVIFASSFPDYPEPPEQLFQGKRVRLTGKVQEHQGVAQIVLERPGQITVLAD